MDHELEAFVPLRELVEGEQDVSGPRRPGRSDIKSYLPIPEPDVLLLQISAEIHVDRRPYGAGLRDDPVGTLFAVHQKDGVREKI